MEGKQLRERKIFNRHEKYHPQQITDSIGFRVMGLFLLVIFSLIFVYEIFYLQSTRSYYYENMAGALTSQARYNADLFLTYLSDEDINTIVLENKNQFYRSTPAQVQILNNAGVVLYDSIASKQLGEELDTSDVASARENKPSYIVYIPKYTDEEVMSVSIPLKNQTNQVGILRLTTSLKEVNSFIIQRFLFSLIFSGVLLLLAALLSFYISRSIIKKIQDLTLVANKLADGQLDVRADENNFGEIGDLARAMNIMSDNLQEKEKIKNDFISSVSHELRTPMTSIKGWTITLQNEEIGDEIRKEGLKIIEKESERLSGMVEDLLDFSRFASNRIRLKKSAFDLVEVSNNLLSQVRPRTREKEMDVVYSYSSPVIEIVADENRIKQLLLNILDNAIKFTDKGGTIFLEILEKDKNVELAITDTGMGIAEDEIHLVTEKFWKGTSSQSHTGLGLSICEEIVKAHGGTLTIKSQLNVGTKVIINLPLEAV